jgi:hypothetical protein
MASCDGKPGKREREGSTMVWLQAGPVVSVLAIVYKGFTHHQPLKVLGAGHLAC